MRRFEGWGGTRVAVDEEEGFVTMGGAGGTAVLVEGTVVPFDIDVARSGLEVERCGGV